MRENNKNMSNVNQMEEKYTVQRISARNKTTKTLPAQIREKKQTNKKETWLQILLKLCLNEWIWWKYANNFGNLYKINTFLENIAYQNWLKKKYKILKDLY